MKFSYKAKTAAGKSVRGIYTAARETDVVDWLRANGCFPIMITATGAEDRHSLSSVFASRVGLRDRLIFFRQLAAMVSAGITVADSLSALAEQTENKRLKTLIRGIYEKVTSGRSLGDAFYEERDSLGAFAIPLVRAGEESGTLDESLSGIADFLEKEEHLRRKIISAVTYPVFVIAIALFVLGMMIAVVIPQFERAFSNLNIELPTLTMMTFSFGRLLAEFWWTFPVGLLVFLFVLSVLRRYDSVRTAADSFVLKLPIFGDIVMKASLARSFGTLSSLLRTGVPVLTALEMSADVSGNEKIRRSFMIVKDGAAHGRAISAVMRDRKLFTPMIGYMTAVGEETGKVDKMLGKAAEWYEEELTEKIKMLTSLLEPVMVVFVGFIVAFMVFAIFLPIISSINAFM
ncbi:MAG: type II secretion system F family protein [Synergistes sp.]|nr:type II secretion system F family protein [Synergistes sp.]